MRRSTGLRVLQIGSCGFQALALSKRSTGMIAEGGSHTVALKSDGTVWAGEIMGMAN